VLFTSRYSRTDATSNLVKWLLTVNEVECRLRSEDCNDNNKNRRIIHNKKRSLPRRLQSFLPLFLDYGSCTCCFQKTLSKKACLPPSLVGGNLHQMQHLAALLLRSVDVILYNSELDKLWGYSWVVNNIEGTRILDINITVNLITVNCQRNNMPNFFAPIIPTPRTGASRFVRNCVTMLREGSL
jgi:hypothetical protein